MALQHTPVRPLASDHGFLRAVLLALAGTVLVLAANLVVGVHTPGQSYDIAPDPAAALPF